MTNICINGLGRIGRAVLRLLWDCENFSVTLLNDINEDVENLAYLIKYDTIYGKLNGDVIVSHENGSKFIDIKNDKKTWHIRVSHKRSVLDISFEKYSCSYFIESSGVNANAHDVKDLNKFGIKSTLVTNTFEEADLTVITGVNDSLIDKQQVISTSICDANAIVPILYAVSNSFSIEHCFVTTLHPFLSYQNVLDGSLRSQSNFGSFYSDYFALGRSSFDNLIPKNTTAGSAIEFILPHLKSKISSFSQRIPTPIVCSADISIVLSEDAEKQDIISCLNKLPENVAKLTYEQLVSTDYIAEKTSTIVDAKWISVKNRRFVKLVIWYDNEWGYSNRVVETLRKLIKEE